MIPDQENQAKIFRAFCDVHRLQILELLRGGEKCTCKILEDLDIGQSSISYHMKVLVESGIVESRQDGKWTHYKICDRGSAGATELLTEITTAAKATEDCVCSEI
jgi:ArsR family transcriptional regulator